ncbi:MOSC domain-containing protein [Roseomonas sp. CCTCC AB2023176]|uniref:MOSC domain-containing protein n=1 Tax=Roseomonas sp. CCTCC AB2023176 TaxID=3342640 RepID=UPI0035DF91A2
MTLPGGGAMALDDPDLASRLGRAAGVEVAPIHLGRGTFDAMPVSLASTAGLAAVGAAHGTPLDRRRFRLNVLIESDEPDSAWWGGILAFGTGADGARVALGEGIPRCAMITLDPDSAARDASVLRTVAQRFGDLVGTYGATGRPGLIRMGDEVRLHRAAA